LGVFARLVPATVFKTGVGCEQRSRWVRFPATPAFNFSILSNTAHTAPSALTLSRWERGRCTLTPDPLSHRESERVREVRKICPKPAQIALRFRRKPCSASTRVNGFRDTDKGELHGTESRTQVRHVAAVDCEATAGGDVRRGLRRGNARPQQGLAGLPANGITPRKFAAMVGNSPTLFS